MKIPEGEADARYTPLLDRARAVVAPVHEGSEKVADFDHVEREIAMISIYSISRGVEDQRK